MNVWCETLYRGTRLSRSWLGLERLDLHFTQKMEVRVNDFLTLTSICYIAPARRLSPHSRGTSRPVPRLRAAQALRLRAAQALRLRAAQALRLRAAQVPS
jgi:hypothetical protein